MRHRVLVTRPQPGAAATAARLETRGYAAVVLPLTEIRPLAATWPDPETVDAVAATSANALRHAPPARLAAFAGRPCFVVGAETATAARDAGFAAPVVGPGDAEGLVRTVTAALGKGRIMFACGRQRRETFEQGLRAAGLAVEPVETYEAVAIERTDEVVAEALGGAPVEAALLHSAGAAEILAGMTARAPLALLFAATRFLCLSPRIADALEGVGRERILVADAPNETALLAGLDGYCGNAP